MRGYGSLSMYTLCLSDVMARSEGLGVAFCFTLGVPRSCCCDGHIVAEYGAAMLRQMAIFCNVLSAHCTFIHYQIPSASPKLLTQCSLRGPQPAPPVGWAS